MSKPKILVGCPIYNRAWILPKWLSALASQDDAEIALAFALTKSNDGTDDIIGREKLETRFSYVDIYNWTGGKEEEGRDWKDVDRVATIAAKRNKLLEIAAKSDCDYYLSLDSDVLVPPLGLSTLLETLSGYDAVCPKVWIWEAFFVAARYERGQVAFLGRKTAGVHPVDIVTSGACLMKKPVVQNPKVRYGVSVLGTDYGWAPGHEINGWNASECIYWSKNAKSEGFKLAANCNLYFPHIMKKEDLKS